MEGQPHKQKVHRVMKDLQKAKLVEQRRDGHYVLTKNKGEEEAAKTRSRRPKRPGLLLLLTLGAASALDRFVRSHWLHEALTRCAIEHPRIRSR